MIPMTPMGQRATDRADHHVVRGDSEVDVLDEGDLEAVRVRVRVRVRVGVRVGVGVGVGVRVSVRVRVRVRARGL